MSDFEHKLIIELEQQIEDMKKVMDCWLEFSKDVAPSCVAGADWLMELRRKTDLLLGKLD